MKNTKPRTVPAKEPKMNKSNENYIDHEVRIRIVEKAICEINNKFNLLIGVLLSTIILPVIMHHYGLV